MMLAACVAVACFLGNSFALEDAEALFQQRQSVSSELSTAHASSGNLDPTVSGIMMSKIYSESNTPGNTSIMLTSTMKCEAFNKCFFPWYVPFAIYFKIDVPDGLSKTDYIQVAYTSHMTYNRSSFWSWFMPKTGDMTGKCHLCSSDCTFNFWSSDYSLNVTTPTILDTLWVCLGDVQKQVLLKKQIWFLPRPTEELALDGELVFRIGLHSQFGMVKADALYRMQVVESDWVTHTTTTTTTTSTTSTATTGTPAVAALARSADGESHSDAMKPSIGMMEVMQQVFSGMAAESKTGATSRAKSWSRWLSPGRVMIFDLSIKSIAAGNSLSYEFDSGCTNPGGDYSALSCRIPVDTTSGTVSATTTLAFEARPGSKLSFAYQTKASTKMMKKRPLYFQKLSIDAPLCGSSRFTRAKVSLWDGAPRMPSSLYKPPECGHYSFDFSTGGPKPINFMSFLDMMTPLGIEPSDDLLPWSKNVWLKLTDHLGTSIVDMEFTIGLDLVRND